SIEQILETHADLPFVLVGDSGQQDPEIYLEVARRYPGRVRVVYIREVATSADRDRELRIIAEEMAGLGVEFVLASDTVTAARHAVSLDLIDEASLAEVQGEKNREDRRSPTRERATRD